MKLSHKVSCRQPWRPGGPIHLRCDTFAIGPSDVPDAPALRKSHRTVPPLENSVHRCSRAQSPPPPLPGRISHYPTEWIRHPLVWFALIISDIDCNGPVSGFRCVPVEEMDCNTCEFIKEYEVIWYEATACRHFIALALWNDNWILCFLFAFVTSALQRLPKKKKKKLRWQEKGSIFHLCLMRRFLSRVRPSRHFWRSFESRIIYNSDSGETLSFAWDGGKKPVSSKSLELLKVHLVLQVIDPPSSSLK